MSTIDEAQLLENTINLGEVIVNDEQNSPQEEVSAESELQMSRVAAMATFQEQIRLQEVSIETIKTTFKQVHKKSAVMIYLGLLFVVFIASGIAMFVFLAQSKNSSMFFLGLLTGALALVSLLVLIVEGFKFYQIRREIDFIDANLLQDNALNVNEKKQGLASLEKIKSGLNGITFLTSLIGNEIKTAALEFQTLRCISDNDKMRINELREHEKNIKEVVRKDVDQSKRLDDEIINVTKSQQAHITELEQLNAAIRSIPTLRNEFGIAHDRYNNLGGDAAEQALEHEWKTRVDEVEQGLKIVQTEKGKVSEKLDQMKKEAEQKYTESKNVKSENDKKQNKLEKEKQNLLKKIEHAHADFDSANKNITETNEKLHEIEMKMAQVTNEAERAQLVADRARLEDRMKKHVNVLEKAKSFIDTSNPTEFDMRIASVQGELLKYNRETEEMIQFYEGEVNKLQNELNRKNREVVQLEDTLKNRQTQRQTALRPFQEQVEVMLGLDKKIREIMQKERGEKPSLEAKIAGITQRIDNLTAERSALEIKVRDDKSRLVLIEDEIQSLGNNFIN